MEKYKEQILQIVLDKKVEQSVRFKKETIKRLDYCRSYMKNKGIKLNRTKAIKIAIDLYLDLIMNENG